MEGYSSVSERGVLRKVATTCFHGDRYTSLPVPPYRKIKIKSYGSPSTSTRSLDRRKSILAQKETRLNFVEVTRCLWLRFTVSHSSVSALHDDFHRRSPLLSDPLRCLNRRNYPSLVVSCIKFTMYYPIRRCVSLKVVLCGDNNRSNSSGEDHLRFSSSLSIEPQDTGVLPVTAWHSNIVDN